VFNSRVFVLFDVFVIKVYPVFSKSGLFDRKDCYLSSLKLSCPKKLISVFNTPIDLLLIRV